MQLAFTPTAWDHYLYWQQTDKKIAEKINELIRDCLRNSFKGIGKPEPLKGNLKGLWSRRISDEHRLVYKIENNVLLIVQCRFHYT
jgi:toxin YoeB